MKSSKKVDSELVKAYETILKKTRDPHMKSMAKKFLEDCGNLKSSDPVDNSRQKKILNHST